VQRGGDFGTRVATGRALPLGSDWSLRISMSPAAWPVVLLSSDSFALQLRAQDLDLNLEVHGLVALQHRLVPVVW
jgi:hypothetical protein